MIRCTTPRPVSGSVHSSRILARPSRSRQLAEKFSAETLDSLIKDAVKSRTPIDGAGGLLTELTKAVLERALQTEVTHHLGYESGDPGGRGSGNSRNGSSSKTITTVNGPVGIAVPRDRNGSFEPVIVPKKARRLDNINSVVLSLYSRGMTTRDIEAHLEEVYGAKVSRELISNITEVVVVEIKAWQSRLLDEVYPILYIAPWRPPSWRSRSSTAISAELAGQPVGAVVRGASGDRTVGEHIEAVYRAGVDMKLGQDVGAAQPRGEVDRLVAQAVGGAHRDECRW